MKIGTLRCWIFGHRFKFVGQEISFNGDMSKVSGPTDINNCTRCGIDKPKN